MTHFTASCFAAFLLLPAGAGTFRVPENTGAAVPFTTQFAADAVFRGELLQSVKRGDIAAEAVTRRAVRLAGTGDQVAFTAERPFNAFVVRYCIPDAPQGGGIEASLSVTAGEEALQPLMLHSRYTWLYASADGGLEENPELLKSKDGFFRNVFDETRVLLEQELPAGTVLTLRKNSGDRADFYIIDLIDFELVPPPLPCPPDALNAADFGATPDDGSDDTAAIQKCLDEAKARGKNVYIPRGVFRQDGVFNLDNITLSGAGMWYTTLVTHVPPSEKGPWSGNLGFRLAGKNITVSDLHVQGISRRRGRPFQRGVTGSGENFTLRNLWLERCGTGIWIGLVRNGTVRDCRFRNNKADGININNNSHDILVENCHARGNGDDSFAAFSNTDKGGGLTGGNSNITFRRNTSESNWWGNGIGLYGGVNHAAEYNLIRGSQPVAGINVSTGHKSWPTNGVSLRGNVLIGCGGVNWNQKFGSIWIFTPGAPLHNAIIEGNIIADSQNDAIKIQGGSSSDLSLVCHGNRILQTTGNGILIMSNVRGKITVKENSFGQIGREELRNEAGNELTILDK